MLDKLLMELKIRNRSPRTINSYLRYNKEFLEFIKKKPEETTVEDIKAYMVFLMDKGIGPRTINLMLSSLSFAYNKIMKKNLINKDDIERPKFPKKLPVVLTREEVKKLMAVPTNFKHRLLIGILYDTGLRVSECVNLKIEDMDLDEKTALVRYGKGMKERNITISEGISQDIKEYLSKRQDNNPYLFHIKDRHISVRQAQKIVKEAAMKAGIKKRVFCHALRSSFATHLLEDKTDLRTIQALLGHERLDTTQIYTQVTKDQIKKVRNPVDALRGRKNE